MYSHSRLCESDEDYAQFSLFFIRHRKDFNSQFSLYNSLEHLLETMDFSQSILSYNTKGELICCAHYWYTNEGLEPDPKGRAVFIDFVLISKEVRSSRVFFDGFRDLANLIAEDNRGVKQMLFHAQAENAYLNRLYSKFAIPIGEHEGYNGAEIKYASDLTSLLHYLNRIKMK